MLQPSQRSKSLLDLILSSGYDLLILSEVRCSLLQQASVMRQALAKATISCSPHLPHPLPPFPPRQVEPLSVLNSLSPFDLSQALSYKRVPIEKDGEIGPLASSYRPIDIYFGVLRALTTTQIRSLAFWRKQVSFWTICHTWRHSAGDVGNNLHCGDDQNPSLSCLGMTIGLSKL